ncbi:hypothetical protein Bbelb_082420 [Branchiostoma belcheri]|nr:hypothetical protein Bbelb_082420 [Branchiostoma belcheri]
MPVVTCVGGRSNRAVVMLIQEESIKALIAVARTAAQDFVTEFEAFPLSIIGRASNIQHKYEKILLLFGKCYKGYAHGNAVSEEDISVLERDISHFMGAFREMFSTASGKHWQYSQPLIGSIPHLRGTSYRYDDAAVAAEEELATLRQRRQEVSKQIEEVRQKVAQMGQETPPEKRQVAAVSLIYKMHMSTCPPDLKKMLPQPYTVRRTTRSSLSTGKHALTVPVSRTHSTGRTFIHTAVHIWNSLPDNVVGLINDNNLHVRSCHPAHLRVDKGDREQHREMPRRRKVPKRLGAWKAKQEVERLADEQEAEITDQEPAVEQEVKVRVEEPSDEQEVS